jgi:hypothetical protein
LQQDCFDGAAWNMNPDPQKAGKRPPTLAEIDACFAELDALGARDFLPDGVPDDPPGEADPRVFFDEEAR